MAFPPKKGAPGKNKSPFPFKGKKKGGLASKLADYRKSGKLKKS